MITKGEDRYRVEKVGFLWCVREGSGTRMLYKGTLTNCQRMAAEFANAFEDGKFVSVMEPKPIPKVEGKWGIDRDGVGDTVIQTPDNFTITLTGYRSSGVIYKALRMLVHAANSAIIEGLPKAQGGAK